MTNSLKTEKWDNSNIYTDFNDPKIVNDLLIIEKNIEELISHKEIFNKIILQMESKNYSDLFKEIALFKNCYRLTLDTQIIIYTLATYAHTAGSINALDSDAKKISDKTNSLSVKLSKAFKPIQLCVLRSPNDFIETFLDDSKTVELGFQLNYERLRNDYLLSVEEEILITGFSLDGLTAWGKLYTDISGSMKVKIDDQMIGLAQANNILSGSDRTQREKAFRGINASWTQNEISACAILNSINGWRNENFHVRSNRKEFHYLDQACHSAHITRKTLDTLIDTTYSKRHLGLEVLKIMSHEFQVEKLGPWDLLAPRPSKETNDKVTYPEAIEIIISAFNEVSIEMGDFAKMMMDKKWIDCAPSENRSQGAYCTGFASKREPRVFMTYDGSIKNVITMAHEIGHAYHNWVMRDISLGEASYPMTLAETASIFAETTVRDYLIKNSKSNEDLKSILWQELQSVQSLMINIPARFEFEKRFVELRKIKNVTVPEVKELMIDSQKHWYENSLSEYDEMFWASKLHFSMSGRSFYNYPYLFGYLFSMGIYAKKDSYGEGFHKIYVDLLRDTGRMTAENLVKKHFQEDISEKEFWLKSISIIEDSVSKYKGLV